MSELITEPPRRSNQDLISRIRLIEGDLTCQNDVDVIVGSIPASLKVNGSLNQALIRAAGEDLDNFILDHIYKPRAGDLYEIPAFNLPVKHLFFVIMPDWKDPLDFEDRDLIRSYRAAMEMAQKRGLTKIAFPALGTGKRKYPLRRAARLGIQGIMDRLTPHFEEVRIVCKTPEQYNAFAEWLEHYSAA